MTRTNQLRRCFTLTEVVLAMTIMTILMGGMASAVLIASHALPADNDASQKTASGLDAVHGLVADLATALTVTEATSTSIEFTVPDRGHGAAGEETIRYAWSGTSGSPLTREYNGAAPVTLCDDIQALSLQYSLSAEPLTHAPRVLLIVANDVVLTAQDQAKRDLLTSWGFNVTLHAAGDPIAEIAAAVLDSDTIYISAEISDADFDPTLYNASVGIVNEEPSLNNELGFASMFGWYNGSDLVVAASSHAVLGPLSESTLTICTSSQRQYYSISLAGGAEPVGYQPWSTNPTLVVVEVDATLYDGSSARGRRVKLPWGGDSFDINTLTEDGRTLMRSAIAWASAPTAISDVQISLQVGTDPGGAVETRVQLLNTPED